MIANFARLLRNSIPSPHFVGRYGGDEFTAVIYDGTEEQVSGILQKLEKEVKDFNHMHHGGNEYVEISYACGHAVSTDYPNCSFRVLSDRADRSMYENKIASHNHREQVSANIPAVIQ